MLKLRPLVVVTGAIHVEGGTTSKQHAGEPKRRKRSRDNGGRTAVITKELNVSEDRDRANVIVSEYSRKLRNMRVLWTPFGTLIDPKAPRVWKGDTCTTLEMLQAVAAELTRKAVEFNKTSKTVEVTNCWLIEPLAGVRRAAVEGWIARGIAKKDPRIVEALLDLAPATAAAAPSTVAV